MDKNFPGYGGKRPLLYKSHEILFLDALNPRLPSEIQGKSAEEVLEALRKYFYLDELASSMAKNGYFDEEPLVGIPKNLPPEFQDLDYDALKENVNYNNFLEAANTQFTIVEGNRRLATVKLLLRGTVNSFPQLSVEIRQDISNLPVVIYPKRKDVISYLGARHIIGVKKWDAYAKARYIASMKDDYHLSIDEIQKSVGDTTNSARKTYASYKLIELVKDEYENYDVSKAKDNFSYLTLALGQGPVKEYIGLPKQWGAVNVDSPIPDEKIGKLFFLFSWLFGEGREKSKVVDESRDITGKLTPVLRDSTATEYLEKYRDLNEAYERCGGEALLTAKYIKRASRDLGRAMPLLSNPLNYNEEVAALLEDCDRLLETIKKINK